MIQSDRDPSTLPEREVETPTVSLGELLEGRRPRVDGHTELRLDGYVDEILRSGFPGLRALSTRLPEAQLDSYLDQIVEREFEELGRKVRRPETLRRWMSAYAAATATTASFEKICDAATGAEAEKPSRPTSIAYRDGTLLGSLFESLMTLWVRVYAQSAGARVSHLRTQRGEHEVDLIVEGGHSIVAIEVKLGQVAEDQDVRHLRRLQGALADDLADDVILATGQTAYRRPDGIAVVPAALLGP